MASHDVSGILKSLEQDGRSPHPKYPVQAQFALKDQRVVASVGGRLSKGQRLTAIHALPYNFRTGLNFIYFELTPAGIDSIGNDCVLVILDQRCTVVGLVDPFDPQQPNRVVPPLPASDEAEPASARPLPFAMSRPSATDTLRFGPEDLYPVEVRSRAFFDRLGNFGGFGNDGGTLGSDGRSYTTYTTQTVWHHGGWTPGTFHWTEQDTKTDSMVDDYIA